MTRRIGRYNLAVKLARAGFRPSKPLVGALDVPPSKSIAQRALVLAGLCRDETAVRGTSRMRINPGEDILAAQELIRQVGASMRRIDSETVIVSGVAPGPLRGWRTEQALDAGESATLARLSSAAAALCGDSRRQVLIGARGSLLDRESPPLFDCLKRAGARITFLGQPNAWPAWIKPVAPPRELLLESPSSSQEVSALLIAAAAWPEPITVVVKGLIPSRPYLELTLYALDAFGATCARRKAFESETFRVQGPLMPPKDGIFIEPDASAAAVLLGAAALTGGEVSIAGLGSESRQGDVRIAEHLAAFGCRAGTDARGLFAAGAIENGAHLHLNGEPDLAPVLAAVAAGAALQRGARSRLSGLETLQGKESARIDVLREGLTALGLQVTATNSSLNIGPGTPTKGPLVLDPRGDHRMAFAFALLGLLREDVDVLAPECVGKSWPDFWSDFERAGATVVRSTT